MKMKATQLRASIYGVLDEALLTGKAVVIERKGRLLKLEPVEKASKLKRLAVQKVMSADPESIVSIDWSDKWSHDLP